MLKTQPLYWTSDMPTYHSLEGWEFEKQRTNTILRLQLRHKRLEKMFNQCIELADILCNDRAFDYHHMAIRIMRAQMEIADVLLFEYQSQVRFNR